MLSVTFSVAYPNCRYAQCSNVNCHLVYPECHNEAIILGVVMLNVLMLRFMAP
jgi:hypothetical protein